MSESSKVEDTIVVVEVLEELTEQEAAERHRLELKVERAFYEAALALRELHSRKLYRSTHNKFHDYCLERFGFSHRNADYLIRAADVIDNLKTGTNGSTFLPSSERQVRPLTTLEPDEQREVWYMAVREAGGKLPSGRIVGGIVQQLKERYATPPEIPYQPGEVVMIRGSGNSELRRKFDGTWALALRVNEYTVTLAIDGKEVAVRPQFLEPIDPKYWADIKAVHERITKLQQYELDPMDDAGLEVLRRRTCFTPRQMMLLERMEEDYAKA